jgi:hypothetical protein
MPKADQTDTAGSLMVGLSVMRASVSKASVAPRHGPFVVWEDTDHIDPPFDLAIDALAREGHLG